LSTHFRKLAIKEIRKETANCVSILFHVPEAWKNDFEFQPGQNLIIRYMADGEEVRRSYSICSSPHENELRVAVKKIEAGRFSSFANMHLKSGDELEVLPPSGRFSPRLSAEHQKNYIAFAAGSGITPIISIIKATLAIEPLSRYTLVYGNQTRGSIIFKEELDALKNKYLNRFTLFHVLSRERTDSPLNEGRINEEKLAALSSIIPIFSMDEHFLCGPEQMIFAVSSFLQSRGVPQKRIHFELFTTRAEQQKTAHPGNKPDTGPAAKSLVTVKSDGISFQFELAYDAASILDAAIATGADLPFACKGGVCSTCRAKLLEGKVHMEVNYALEEDELEAGFILTCQSHPRSEHVVVDYDAK
jgi:ring-1,2-phenylacetyl-CoA epoxidase subunit PaaE